MKKFVTFAIVIAVCIGMIFSSSLNVFAAERLFDQEWGTYEEGIIPKYPEASASYYRTIPGDGFPNGDFEQGLKYWTHFRFLKPSETVDLIKEGDNTFIRFNCENEWEGIESLVFTDSRLKVGEKYAIMYDWRSNDPNFQVFLSQHYNSEGWGSGGTHRVAIGKGVTLVEATSDDEWNRTVTAIKSGDDPGIVPVKEPTNKSGKIYLNYVVQIASDPTTVADIDNLTLVIYDDVRNKIFDLDGKELYDIASIEQNAEDDIDPSDFDDIDFGAGEENEEKDNTTDASTEDNDEDTNSTEEKGGFVGSLTFWIIIGVGAAVIIAVAVIVIIIVSKKKKTTEE